MYEFSTPVEVEIYSHDLERLSGCELDLIITEQVTIKWTLELEMRSYGIKYAIASVPDQVIYIEVKGYVNKHDTEPERFEYRVELKDITVNKNDKFPECPTKLQYDGEKWTLEF